MKKLFPFAVIAAIAMFALTTSCKKSSDSGSSASMSATINGNAWTASVDSAYNMGGIGLYIYGYSLSGSQVQIIQLNMLTAPTATGDIQIGVPGGAIAQYATNLGGKNAAYGVVTISSISSTNVTGTFSFTCEDSTKVTNGKFNLPKR